MHEHPIDKDKEAEPAQLQPRIYVASLADYNAGRLYGTWLDAARSAGELSDDIDQLLAGAPTPGAEEWAIHDFEGFGPLQLAEYTDLATVSRLANGIAQYGEAFAVFAEVVGPEAVDPAGFEQAYRGTWDSTTAYAEQLLDDLGAEAYLRDVPNWLRPYVQIDSDAFARDLELGGDIYAARVADGVAVFDAHA